MAGTATLKLDAKLLAVRLLGRLTGLERVFWGHLCQERPCAWFCSWGESNFKTIHSDCKYGKQPWWTPAQRCAWTEV